MAENKEILQSELADLQGKLGAANSAFELAQAEHHLMVTALEDRIIELRQLLAPLCQAGELARPQLLIGTDSMVLIRTASLAEARDVLEKAFGPTFVIGDFVYRDDASDFFWPCAMCVTMECFAEIFSNQ